MAILLSVLSPLIGAWIYQIAIIRQLDIVNYRSMLEQKEIAASNVGSPTNQHRKQVCKDIWFSQTDHSRLHYQITSEGSVLSFIPCNNKFDIVESLQGVRCWMQEKLISGHNPTQQARLIEAESGVYRYLAQEFTATSVLLSLFKLPGHSLPKEPIEKEAAFLRGIARDISYIFSGKTPQFQAEHFEAIVVKE